MLGKIRLALSPPQPNWMFTALHLTPRGITSGFIPYGGTSVEVVLDVFDSTITIARSDGSVERISLLPARTVADVYADVSAALRKIDVACYISPFPQEIPDTTPLGEDRRPSEYDPDAVLRWFRVVTVTATVFEEWRRQFFGRSGIQLWWGAFDFAMLLFSGRKVTPPVDRGYIMKYDLDAELMNVGLYFGDERTEPFFYGYIFPEPANSATLAVAPPSAQWSVQMKEWILPYDAVAASDNPAAALTSFVDSMYELCFAAGGWRRESYRYDAPKGVRQPR